MTIASITDDPRFKLARSLLVGGQCCNDASNKNEDDDDNVTTLKSSASSPQEEAITIFATLLEECITINGETSYNTAVCQFEYGNALFRAVVRRRPIFSADINNGNNEEVTEDDRKIAAATKTTTMMTNNNNEKRESMAAAAMKHSAFDDVTKDDDNEVEMERRCNKRVKHENGKLLTDNQSTAGVTNDNLKADPVKEDNGNDDDDDYDDNGDDNDDDDLDLAFEMMDTSWSIFLSLLVDDDGGSSVTISDNNNTTKVDEQDNNVKGKLVIQTWVNDQLPRVLRGIGDLYSYRGEYANAVDVYIRAMHYREEAWDQLEKTTSSSIDELRCKRLLVELYALISETLLYCPPGQDIIAHHPKMSGENKTILLSKSNNRLDIAQSYYEMARLGLEDVLCLYGKIMAKSTATTTTILTTKTSISTATMNQQQDQRHHIMMDNMLKNEKEDIGYLVMTIVGIGNTILHKE
jgi:tetratricopeptide (TPR) repeat protein